LLRSPGQSLLKKVDFINQEITIYTAYLFLGPISVYAIYVSHLYFNKRVPSLLSLGFFSAFVALPGWFVMRTSSEGIPVLNPILFRSLLKQIQPQNLSEKTIKRIVHQLEQKCRDVEPTSNIAEQD
jgi:hypothetical protein